MAGGALLSCKCICACELGDPISCIYLGAKGCMAGTLLGKVWLFSFDSKQRETLAAFSDDGIRGLYLGDEDCYATIGEAGCRVWKTANPHSQTRTVRLRVDKKSTQSVKHVLQKRGVACVLYMHSTTVVNVTNEEHAERRFKLFDFGSTTEIAPCDFDTDIDGERLIVVDRTHAYCPIFRVVHLEKEESTKINDLPKSNRVSLVKFWGRDCLVYVVNGDTIYIFDFRQKQLKHRLVEHRSEIVAIDADDPTRIVSLSTDAVVKIWNGVTGECERSERVPEANFFLGFPYCLSVHEKCILVSADEGVYLMEFEEALRPPAGIEDPAALV